MFVGKIICTNGDLTLGFEEHLVEFKKIMDQMLAGLDFAKCYINNIIIFNLISRDYTLHLHEVLNLFKDHNLKLHHGKC
jgi:hypothetical protein